MTCMSEGSRLRDGVKDSELVPIHSNAVSRLRIAYPRNAVFYLPHCFREIPVSPPFSRNAIFYCCMTFAKSRYPLFRAMLMLFGRLAHMLLRREPFLHLERCHAAQAGRCHGLAINIVGHIARGINTRNGRRGRAAFGDDVSAGI